MDFWFFPVAWLLDWRVLPLPLSELFISWMLPERFSLRVLTVSYTHLDVYKRQVSDRVPMHWKVSSDKNFPARICGYGIYCRLASHRPLSVPCLLYTSRNRFFFFLIGALRFLCVFWNVPCLTSKKRAVHTPLCTCLLYTSRIVAFCSASFCMENLLLNSLCKWKEVPEGTSFATNHILFYRGKSGWWSYCFTK